MNEQLTYLSDWKIEDQCINCNKILNFHEVYNSRGLCPKCGYKDKNAVTIVKTKEIPYRLARRSKWWEFWKPVIRIYKDN